MSTLLRQVTPAAIAVVVLSVFAATLSAQDEQAPAQAEKKIDPKADAVLRAATKHLADKQGLSFRFVQSINVTGAGLNQQQEVNSAAAIRRPNLFSFNMEQPGMGKVRVVSNGEKMYTFLEQFNKYLEQEPPASLDKLDESGNPIISSFAPAGFLATTDLYESIVGGVQAIEHIGQEKIGESNCDHLRFTVDLKKLMEGAAGGLPAGAPEGSITIDAWIAAGDEPTLRRLVPDMQAMMKAMAANAPPQQAQMFAQMKFEMVINYDRWQFGDAVAADRFAFTPPADAQKAGSLQEVLAGAAAGGGGNPADALKGKAAPQFELDLLDQDGKATLAAHKDKHIVILDFWATWCGPCVRALPILEKVTKEYKDKGVVFYAVNQREDPQQVRQFMEQREFSFNVAMDTQGQVGGLFNVRGIPQTVIVAPDGKVHQVHVGFSPNLEQTLRQELDELIKEFQPKAN